MLNWLRRYLSTDQRELEALARRVTSLERSEVGREAEVNDALDKLNRFYKRLRQRTRLDVDHVGPPEAADDPITRAVLQRRQLRIPKAEGGEL